MLLDKPLYTVYINSIILLQNSAMKSPFLTMVQEHMYLRRYAKRTIESHLRWIAAFIR